MNATSAEHLPENAVTSTALTEDDMCDECHDDPEQIYGQDPYEYAELEKDPVYKECPVCGEDILDCSGHPSVAWPEEWKTQ